MKQRDSLEDLHNRMQYIVKRYGYRVTDQGYQDYGYAYEDIMQTEELEAVNRRYALEQLVRNIHMQEQMDRVFLQRDNMADETERKSSAMWHVTCFTDDDRRLAEHVMTGLGCKSYRLYKTIDQCLEEIFQRNSVKEKK